MYNNLPLNLSGSNVLTGSTPSAGPIECSIVTCQANHCPNKIDLVFSVHIKSFSGSSPGWKPPSPFLRLIGKISSAGCWSGRLSSRQAYYLWRLLRSIEAGAKPALQSSGCIGVLGYIPVIDRACQVSNF